MLVLLLIAVVLFVLAPYDAQLWLLGGVRAAATHPLLPYVAAGALGALVVGLAFYAHVWNALAYQLYLDDVAKATDMYRRRRK